MAFQHGAIAGLLGIMMCSVSGAAYAQKIVNMDLVGQLGFGPTPLCTISGAPIRVNDVWGYDSSSGEALAIVGLCDGTRIVDVTDPANPVEVASIPGPRSVWRDIKTFGQFAYILHDTPHSSNTAALVGIQIVDLEDTSYPVVATLSDHFVHGHNLFIDTDRGHLYVADYTTSAGGGGGILIYDLSTTPTAPTLLGQWDGAEVHDLSVRGTVGYLAALNDGLKFLDVTDPASPALLDTFQYQQQTGTGTLDNFTHNVWTAADGSWAVVTDEQLKQRLKFIELPTFATASIISEYEPVPDILPHNAIVLGDYTYVSYYSEGAIVLHSADPSQICEIGYYDTFPSPVGSGPTDAFRGAWGIYPFTATGLVYVSDITDGLYIFEFDPPSRDPVDLALVLDVSGSMASVAIGGTQPKLDVLKGAVELLVETWRPFAVPGDSMGLVYFESGVQTAFIDPEITTSLCASHQAFVDDVNGRTTGNLTGLGAGLLTAVRAYPNDGRSHATVIVTDGMQNVSPMIVPAGIEAVFFDLGDTLGALNTDGQFELFTNAEDVVTGLKATGVRVGVITNVPAAWTEDTLRNQMVQPDFLDEFEVLMLSSEASAPKPDPVIFLEAWQEMPNRPPIAHVAFVTETLEHLTSETGGQPQGAMAVGMVGIHMTSATTAADHAASDLLDVLTIVQASATPGRHETIATPLGTGVYHDSGVPGEPGVALEDLGTTIHTIGIGTAPGSQWEELIEDMAAETGGLHHFTSAPDADLINFLEDDLVAALQTGSVYRVARVVEELDAGDRATADVLLNSTISKMVARLSWQGIGAEGEFEVQLVRLDEAGEPVAFFPPSNVTGAESWLIASWELPLRDQEGAIELAGGWRVVATRNERSARPTRSLDDVDTEAFQVTLSVLVDDSRLRSRINTPRGPFETGAPIPIEADFALDGSPLDNVAIEVVVFPPGTALGTLLTDNCAGRARFEAGTEAFDRVEACIERLATDPEFASKLASTPNRFRLEPTGNGRYTSAYANTTVSGSYRFQWIATGSAAGEGFIRRGEFTRMVSVRTFHENSVELIGQRISDDRLWTRFEVTPHDHYGNFLGPGYADRISVFIPGVERPLPVVDQLDGSYRVELELAEPEVLYEATVLIRGERIPVQTDQVDEALHGPRLFWHFLLWLVIGIFIGVGITIAWVRFRGPGVAA